MHQIRHILNACLILLMIAMGMFLYFTFPESGIIGEKTVITNGDPAKEEIASKGKKLFQQQCASCHSLNKELAGPALAGVHNRGPWSERDNLIKWIKNPAVFIPTTKYTIELQKKYSGIIMPSFGHLTDEEINEIIDYIRNHQTNAIPIAFTGK